MRQNMVRNPAAAVDLTGITAQALTATGVTISRVTDWSPTGLASVRYQGTVTATNGYVGIRVVNPGEAPCSPGDVLYASAIANVIDGAASGNGTYTQIRWFRADDTLISVVQGQLGNLATGVRTADVLAAAPDETAYATVYILTQTTTTSDTIDVKAGAFQLERLSTKAELDARFNALAPASDLALFDEWSTDPDGALGSANTGQAWTRSHGGNGSDFVVNGHRATALTPLNGSSYAETDLVDPVTVLRGGFVFDNGTVFSGNTSGVATGAWSSRISASLPNVPDTPLHFVIQPGAWGFGYFSGGSLTTLGSENFASTLAHDGATQHEFSLIKQGPVVVIRMPDGQIRVFYDSNLGSIGCRWPFFEVQGADFNAGGCRGRWDYFGASTAAVDTGLSIPTYADGDSLGWQWDGTAGLSASRARVAPRVHMGIDAANVDAFKFLTRSL